MMLLIFTGLLALATALAGLLAANMFGDALVGRQLRQRVNALGKANLAKGAARSHMHNRGAARPLLRAAGGRLDTLLLQHLPLARWFQRQIDVAGGGVTLTGIARALAAVLLASGSIAIVVSSGLQIMATMLIAFLGAGALAALWVSMRAQRYRSGFARAFPDAVAMLVRGLRAGLGISAIIIELGRDAAAPADVVFRQIAETMRLGQSLEAALWAAARRLSLPDFDFLVVTIALQIETGGNIAETLGRLDDTLRMRRQLALKVKAMSAEARASAGIIGSMPIAMALLMLFVAPDYLSLLFTTQLGHILVAAGLASLGIGAAIISRMMRVEV